MGFIVQFVDKGLVVRLWMMRRNMVFVEFVIRQLCDIKLYLVSVDGVLFWKWNYFGIFYDKVIGIVILFVNSKLVVCKKIGYFDLLINYDVYLGVRLGDKYVFCG